jgi:hypothetical protein
MMKVAAQGWHSGPDQVFMSRKKANRAAKSVCYERLPLKSKGHELLGDQPGAPATGSAGSSLALQLRSWRLEILTAP